MKEVTTLVIYARDISLGLKRRIGATGDFESDIAAAIVGKSVARGGDPPADWSYVMTSHPGFLSRPQKMMRQGYVVTSTSDHVGHPEFVDFMSEDLR